MKPNRSSLLPGLRLDELSAVAVDLGESGFRGRQLADWLYRKWEFDPAGMTNLPGRFRAALADRFTVPARVADRSDASDGTSKLLLELADGETVELALIPAAERNTVCLSTQVGCPVGCRFCASGANGFRRNLAAGEMLAEFLLAARAFGQKPDNLVFMGIGEGLLNFDELAAALEILTSPDAVAMSPRRITVSTSGYVPGIDRLAALDREFTLAISLHAPNDAVRARLIPDALRFPVADILAAADRYRERAGRMVTFEYALLDGLNDAPAHASELAALAIRHHAKVNLIPFNSTGAAFRRPAAETIRKFAAILENAGAHVTVRRERGAGADAACGQLRLRKLDAVPSKKQ